MKRKIAAILAADVVGYSRLVGEDEEETLRRLEKYRGVFSDFISRFGGRIFNTAGDAIMAEFPSALDAVRCAVDTQESLRTRNLAYPPSRHMNFRIGITMGDVVERDGDLLGEGVNIAARLEGIAPVGGICISRSVHEAVANKISLKFADVGEQQLKNLPDRIHAYTVTLEQAESRNPGQHLKAAIKPIWYGAGLAIVAILAGVAYLWGALRANTAPEQKAVVSSFSGQPTKSDARPVASPPDVSAVTGTKLAEANGSGNKGPVGEWKGVVTENGGNTYNVAISLDNGGKGTVSYPELKCSGTLEYILRRGETHVFREKITKGSECGRTAEVEIRLGSREGSALEYTWIGQGPKLTGHLSGEEIEPENCQKYLPNIGVIVPARCDLAVVSSDTTPPTAQVAVDIDPATLGTWILTVPRGHWIWVTRDDGTYEFHSEAYDGAPPHSGRFDAKDGRWSLQATSGFSYTDGGTYQVLPSGVFLATGRLGAGAWQPANPVRRTH